MEKGVEVTLTLLSNVSASKQAAATELHQQLVFPRGLAEHAERDATLV